MGKQIGQPRIEYVIETEVLERVRDTLDSTDPLAVFIDMELAKRAGE